MSIISVISSSGPTRPNAPTIGSATAGDTSASITFTAPTYTGRSAITTYTATSSPGSITGTSASSPVTVSGLTNGTAYTFTVTATNAAGLTSVASAASNSVTPVTPSSFESITSTSGSGSGAVTFSSIPGTYKMLQLRLFLNDNTNSDSGVYITFNGGTNSQISDSRIGARGTTASTSASNQASGNGVYIRTFGTSTIGAPAIINIYDYASTSKFKSFDMRNGFVAASASDADSSFRASVYASTSAITSITLTSQASTFRSTNNFALYGIK